MKYLIVGLGNIGPEYELTRHNIGFLTLDRLADKEGVTWKSERLAFKSEIKHKGRSLHLIKPTTYMNLSGRAVKYYLNELKIPIDNLLVITDDLALPFGTLRLRGKGSDGGHNGLKSIDFELQTNQYARLRFGIGNDFPKGMQIEYVLGKWTKEQSELLPERLKMAGDICRSFCTAGLANTMSAYNNK